jgi:hypothetical protein
MLAATEGWGRGGNGDAFAARGRDIGFRGGPPVSDLGVGLALRFRFTLLRGVRWLLNRDVTR